DRADLVVADREVALDARIAGVGCRELLVYRERLLMKAQRLLAPAAPPQHLPDPAVGSPEGVLPACVAGIGCDQLLADGKAPPVGIQTLLASTHQKQDPSDPGIAG